MRSLVFFAALLPGLLTALPAAAQDSVQVEALMPGMAVLTIDGRRHTLREGDSEAGVRLVSANGREAVLEIGGERRRAGVSDRIAGAYTEPEKRSVTVARDERMQYRTSAAINGRRMEVLIDTGANVVALSRQHVAALGINPVQRQHEIRVVLLRLGSESVQNFPFERDPPLPGITGPYFEGG